MSQESGRKIEHVRFALASLCSTLQDVTVPLNGKLADYAMAGDTRSPKSVSLKIRLERLMRLRTVLQDLRSDDTFWRDILRILDAPVSAKHIAVERDDLPPAA